MQTADVSALLESSLLLVDEIVAELAHRQRVRDDDLNEFRSLAYLKLIEHDAAVLRRFQGTSSLRTYLTVVLHRVLLDHRNREWGRWRPSAAAHRIGPEAVRLERLVTRDGLTVEEALATVAPEDQASCRAFLETLRVRGPVRGTRATVGEEAIPERPDPSDGPDAFAERREREVRIAVLRRMVRDALRTLDSQDHLIITLRFRDGLSVAEVARVLDVDAKPLYRRIDRILGRLHSLLSADLTGAELARELAGETWCDDLPGGESEWWRPSKDISGSALDGDTTDARGLSRSRAARSVHRRRSSSLAGAHRRASL